MPKEPIPPFFGEVSAIFNDEAWEASPLVRFYENDNSKVSITMKYYLYEGYSVNFLGFFQIPLTLDTLDLINTSTRDGLPTSFFMLQDGDAIISQYFLADMGFDNQLIITNYDEESRSIEGTFQAGFLIDSLLDASKPYLPDTMIFKNGHFTSKVFELCE